MHFTLSTLGAMAAALALTSATTVSQTQQAGVATILLTTNNDAPFTELASTLGAVTRNNERVLRASVRSQGRNPWCAGFSDAGATQFLRGSNGDGIFNSANTAVYSTGSFGAEVKSFWCAETKPEVEAFISSCK